jgi:hypothetical protein
MPRWGFDDRGRKLFVSDHLGKIHAGDLRSENVPVLCCTGGTVKGSRYDKDKKIREIPLKSLEDGTILGWAFQSTGAPKWRL